MMMEENISDEQQEKISSMMKTVNRLKKIVHSLLYISRIENDQFAKTDTVNIYLSVEIMEELSARLETKSLQFINQISVNINVKGVNRDLVFQLLYNLINNAIRYNKENGSLQISDHFHAGDPYVLEIKDTGVGINNEELSTVFHRFKTGKDKTEGFGLGLSIVKTILSFLGFEISVTSEQDKWTLFSITIPSERIEVI
jgi:two-component system, OmpR family, sensor histidine kinase ArlS